MQGVKDLYRRSAVRRARGARKLVHVACQQLQWARYIRHYVTPKEELSGAPRYPRRTPERKTRAAGLSAAEVFGEVRRQLLESQKKI